MAQRKVNRTRALGFLGWQVTETHLDNERSHWLQEPEGGSKKPAARGSNGFPAWTRPLPRPPSHPETAPPLVRWLSLAGTPALTRPLWAAGSCDGRRAPSIDELSVSWNPLQKTLQGFALGVTFVSNQYSHKLFGSNCSKSVNTSLFKKKIKNPGSFVCFQHDPNSNVLDAPRACQEDGGGWGGGLNPAAVPVLPAVLYGAPGRASCRRSSI